MKPTNFPPFIAADQSRNRVIEYGAAIILAEVKTECDSLRRTIGQRFRWLRVDLERQFAGHRAAALPPLPIPPGTFRRAEPVLWWTVAVDALTLHHRP